MANEVLADFPIESLRQILPLAFSEDVQNGDLTSLATIPKKQISKAHIIAKEPGVIVGLPLIQEIFNYRNTSGLFTCEVPEGTLVEKNEVISNIETNTLQLLQCERILLNLLQHMCGIATMARSFQEQVKNSSIKILDTRKTIPGYRVLDKYAVRMGGAYNHRQGLFDHILIKDNHIQAAGSARAAVDKAYQTYGKQYPIEAEVSDLEELQSLMDSPVDWVLLDNMDNNTIEKAIEITRTANPNIKLEASGNMNLDRVKELSKFDLDYISVGALTHSFKAMDLSLKFL